MFICIYIYIFTICIYIKILYVYIYSVPGGGNGGVPGVKGGVPAGVVGTKFNNNSGGVVGTKFNNNSGGEVGTKSKTSSGGVTGTGIPPGNHIPWNEGGVSGAIQPSLTSIQDLSKGVEETMAGSQFQPVSAWKQRKERNDVPTAYPPPRLCQDVLRHSR